MLLIAVVADADADDLSLVAELGTKAGRVTRCLGTLSKRISSPPVNSTVRVSVLVLGEAVEVVVGRVDAVVVVVAMVGG